MAKESVSETSPTPYGVFDMKLALDAHVGQALAIIKMVLDGRPLSSSQRKHDARRSIAVACRLLAAGADLASTIFGASSPARERMLEATSLARLAAEAYLGEEMVSHDAGSDLVCNVLWSLETLIDGAQDGGLLV